MKFCDIYKLGVIDYQKAYNIQKTLVRQLLEEKINDTILFLEHPPTITIGKLGKIENVLVSVDILKQRGISLYFIDRGGDVTYHGPGQLVGYIIMNIIRNDLDLHTYINKIEQSLIKTLKDLHIDAYRKENYRGVWTNSGKIASIGIRIVKSVSMHGFALNIEPNMEHFNLIIPCGLDNVRMTSVYELKKEHISMDYVIDLCKNNVAKIFKLKIRELKYEY